MDAIKTTYLGKEFKSKSEAMFANILEQMKQRRNYLRWVYEPKQFETKDKYIPDFIVYEGDELFLADWIYLIEYKPTMPTDSYISHLSKQFEEIKAKDCYGFIDSCYMVIGNCFDDNFTRLVYDFKSHLFFANNDSLYWIEKQMVDKAKSYRYDLYNSF